MNAREKLQDALRAYDRIEPADDVWERVAGRADVKPLPFRRGRALVVGVVGVLAVGAIVGVRLAGDRDRGGVRLVTPLVSPGDVPSLLPSPTPPSASPSPSPSPPAGMVKYVSEDGVWELFYPRGWFGPDEPHVAGEFSNYRNRSEEVPLPIKVDLVSLEPDEIDSTKPPPQSLDDLLVSMCDDSGGRVQVFECKKVEINGRMWAWALLYSDSMDEPAMVLDVRTIAGGKVYGALGYVFATGGHGPAIAQIREVFESLVLNI